MRLLAARGAGARTQQVLWPQLTGASRGLALEASRRDLGIKSAPNCNAARKTSACSSSQFGWHRPRPDLFLQSVVSRKQQIIRERVSPDHGLHAPCDSCPRCHRFLRRRPGCDVGCRGAGVASPDPADRRRKAAEAASFLSAGIKLTRQRYRTSRIAKNLRRAALFALMRRAFVLFFLEGVFSWVRRLRLLSAIMCG
jgi:hypothetical protein